MAYPPIYRKRRIRLGVEEKTTEGQYSLPKQPWFDALYDICIEHYANPEAHIGHLDLQGWKFVSHTIAEKDSCGPVTSILKMRSPFGCVYSYLI